MGAKSVIIVGARVGGLTLGALLARQGMQVRIIRPAHRSRAVGDLWYTGGHTHPGIRVPMAFISSRIVAEEIARRGRS